MRRRGSIRRLNLVLTLGAAGLLGLRAAGCRQAPKAALPIRIVVHSESLSLDPHFNNEVMTFSILANLFEGPTAFDGEQKLVPRLVSSWENPDEKTWRLHVRDDARFHDGRPVEAQDIVASIQRIRTHARSQLKSYLVEVESERVTGPRTLEITTRRPYAPLLNKLAFCFVVPRGSPAEITNPIGTGPYRMGTLEKGKLLRLEPFEPSGKASLLSPLEFRPISDPAKRVIELLQGRADLAQDLPPNAVSSVQQDPCCRVESRPSSIVEYLHFGVWDPRFKDHRVREAISLAIDRRVLVERVFRGFGQPASQMVGPGVFGYDAALPVPARDLARARRLLAEAGYPNGFDVTLEYRESRNGAELARQLNDIGVRVKLSCLPWAELFTRLSRQQVPFYYGGVTAVTADASDVLDSFAHSRSNGYGSTNHSGYSNPELDRLIEESGSTLVMAQRRSMLQKCMRLMMDDLYLVPLVIPYDLYGVRKELSWTPRIDLKLLGREMKRIAPAT
jgi:peptide/nickel transport system substrate-binding protein